MKTRTGGRSGFTLIEMLIILAIMAALAAVLLPTLTNQIQKSEVSRVTGDLTNLRTAAEAFLVDVHRYPGDIEDLGTPITATDTDADTVAYPPGLVARWDGPYIDRVVADGDSLETGFGGQIQDDLVKVEYPAASGIFYLTVNVSGFAQSDFDRVDEGMDDADGAAAGRLRWITPDTVRFLAIPIN